MADFIGRTNFLDGQVDGNQIVFSGFTVPLGSAPDFADLTGAASFSVRPQTIDISPERAPSNDGGWWVRGKVAERAYLGEYWEYLVRPDGCDLRLRVTTPPTTVYEAEQAVWLRIDPKRIARVPSPLADGKAP